ncbi:hypothetical protein P691DRAFT_762423 [Macrolepiota fuliginosa MF-IS2]|uniref:F-box domain-containing protein n=1 Tax=Macrolepiota fuliginosa MF-IS2 TaxID=1400762 RepID=A0A9P6C1N2_9AGAR|nr:hypothetical protein P691DRAFT_762423 [Macrolepiota fuliginosa MF-IS2]
MPPLQLGLDDTPLITCAQVDGLHVPDLPPELWIEILSYIPRGLARKTIGINRYLFEKGMNELYTEIWIDSHQGVGRKTFEQMRYPSISSRVRQLSIQPKFLPGLCAEESRTKIQLKARKTEIRQFLDTALATLTNCSQLRDLKIILHDQILPKSFLTFLKKLIKRIGHQLRTLTLDVTCSCFLPICDFFPKRLIHLSSLTVAMTDSDAEPPSAPEVRKACRALIEIITSARKTLQSLAMESFTFSFVDFLEKLPNIPSLRSFEVRASYISSTLSPGTHLRTLLQKQDDNLERLAIRQPRVAEKGAWLPDETLMIVFDPVFSLRMSTLQELDLEIEYRVILARLTRYIVTFAPCLKRLTLWGQNAALTYNDFLKLLDLLHNSDSGLEHLQISVMVFSPDHLDLLSSRLPPLKALDLRYKLLGESKETNGDEEDENVVYQAFRSRRYAQWKLKSLKIMHLPEIPRSQKGYPDTRLINTVAQSLPSLTRVVRSWDEDL